MTERSSGVLLHITSLPGPEGNGTLGNEAYRFVDFLAETNQKVWQILPLGPVGYGNSPYQCYSAFAGNPMMIDLAYLIKDSLLTKDDLKKRPRFSHKQVDFEKTESWKYPLLRRAFERYQAKKPEKLEFDFVDFLKEHDWWLHDYALFMAAKNHFKNEVWDEWEHGLKFRGKEALEKYEILLEDEISFRKFIQFLFFRQWFQLKKYANLKGVSIVGDMPLYVSGDSVDVWSNTDIFLLDKNLKPTKVGGVPPDYFSETGQLWGNPVFDWKRLEKRGFDWWLARLHFNLHLFDEVRIDHFRGLEAYWSVPAEDETAMNGEWVPAGGFKLLNKFKEQTGSLQLIAEDLGFITEEVHKLREDFDLPGMKVLQFAFGSDETNINLPHNYEPNFVVYTGTHDNDTTLGWLEKLEGEEKKKVRWYLGRNKKKALKNCIEAAWSSCAKMAVLPMQDVLQLGSKSRMNTPGTATGNWDWRFRWSQLKKKHVKFLDELTRKYNR